MKLQLIHTLHDNIEARWGERVLFRYVYQPHTDPIESPRPYLHPVQTLAGERVTNFRPHDHPWHKGISMTSAHLSGQNFWGGATYVRDQGYTQLDNNGRTQHLAWNELQCDGEHAQMSESLQWVTQAGETWLAEQRQVGVSEVNPADGYWVLAWSSRLTNLTSHELRFGSPTTAGRPMAGYGGLFWRGPRSFTGGQIMAADGQSGPDVMGKRAAWLAYIGAHDGSGAQSTLVFIDDPANPRYPTQWFVRNDPYAGASFALSFDEAYALAPGAELALRYHIVIADGAWTRQRISDFRLNADTRLENGDLRFGRP
jgi:hypothetical protein